MTIRRVRFLLVLLVLPVLAAGGCGEPVVGGSGHLERAGPEGAIAHLVLAGSPYEMGWWHGRRLGAEIRALHAEWHDRVLARVPAGGGRDLIRTALRTYAAQALVRLPEAFRQELDGMADACGVSAEDLVRTAVMRDGLRFHPEARRLLGAVLAVAPGGPEARIHPVGEEARGLLRDRWLVVERRPREGTPTLLLAWPGSLGGIGGASAQGLAILAAEVGLPREGQAVGRTPFTIRLRSALESATDAQGLLDALVPTTGHRVVVLDGSPRRAVLGLTGLGAELTADLTAHPFFELAAEAQAGDVEVGPVPPGPALDVLGAFERVRRESGADGRLWMGVRWRDDAFEIVAGSGGDAGHAVLRVPDRP